MRALFRARPLNPWIWVAAIAAMLAILCDPLPRLYDSQAYIYLPGAGRIPVESTAGCDPQEPGIRAAYIYVFAMNGQVVARCALVKELGVQS